MFPSVSMMLRHSLWTCTPIVDTPNGRFVPALMRAFRLRIMKHFLSSLVNAGVVTIFTSGVMTILNADHFAFTT